MTATEAKPTETANGELTHRQILTILYGLLLGMALAALDQTIVATAIKTIGDDLDDLSAQAWVTTAFLITSTITTPLFGKLSDIFGRKRLFMLSIVIFVAASALCGLSQSMYELAIFRALQGIGAGGIMPLALAVIADIIPPRQRARYQGYLIAVFASASVLGPVLGGLLSGQKSILGVSGWRWIFYLNVPIAAIALVVIARVLREDHDRRSRRIDWGGAVTLAVGLVPLLIVAEQGRTWGWSSIGAFVCYVVGVTGLVAFVWIQGRMGDDALLPIRLFRVSTFSVASAQTTVIGMAMFGGIAVIPLYLQIVKGASPTKAGLLIIPLVGGTMLASLTSGRIIARTGRYKIFPIIGSVLIVIGMGLLTRLGADTPLWQADIYMLTFGIGMGLNMQSLVLAMQNSVSPNDIGVASSSSTFFRTVGGTLGTAIFLSILFSASQTKIADEYEKAQTNPAFQAAVKAHPDQLAILNQHLGSGLNDSSFLKGLDPSISRPFFVGFSSAADLVFLVCAVILLSTVVLAISLKEVPLRLVSAAQARAQSAAGSDGDPTTKEMEQMTDGRAKSQLAFQDVARNVVERDVAG
ncbi:MAG: EmrB/QacA subfamily drug resistance transporter [Pseudonocardiales bacterium]|nr:EmrB/QacA subfamily drug resistance transporter [Pseudonocardiales bacterium]